eukprot:Nk52_evm120s352 gene=Nk52_evmTU120s352
MLSFKNWGLNWSKKKTGSAKNSPADTPSPKQTPKSSRVAQVEVNSSKDSSNHMSSAPLHERQLTLERSLSDRISKSELIQKNIMHEHEMNGNPSFQDNANQLEKQFRRQSLKLKLELRPDIHSLRERNIIPENEVVDYEENPPLRDPEEEALKANRVRKLSNHLLVRPPKSALKQRNILRHDEVDGSLQEATDKLEKMHLMDTLNEKIKRRPSAQELQERNILRFDEVVVVGVTHSPKIYNRRSSKPWTKLTNRDKASIRKELNEFKSTMEVHDESQKYTRYHK